MTDSALALALKIDETVKGFDDKGSREDEHRSEMVEDVRAAHSYRGADIVRSTPA
jgi:hypothetical protein